MPEELVRAVAPRGCCCCCCCTEAAVRVPELALVLLGAAGLLRSGASRGGSAIARDVADTGYSVDLRVPHSCCSAAALSIWPLYGDHSERIQMSRRHCTI